MRQTIHDRHRESPAESMSFGGPVCTSVTSVAVTRGRLQPGTIRIHQHFRGQFTFRIPCRRSVNVVYHCSAHHLMYYVPLCPTGVPGCRFERVKVRVTGLFITRLFEWHAIRVLPSTNYPGFRYQLHSRVAPGAARANQARSSVRFSKASSESTRKHGRPTPRPEVFPPDYRVRPDRGAHSPEVVGQCDCNLNNSAAPFRG